jgi:hypothetical protein
MKRFAPIIFVLLQLPIGAGWSIATEPVGVKPEPKKQPAPSGRITPEKLTGKAGKLLVVDASKATGDVIWDWPETAFDADASLVDGKRLILSMPPATKDTQIFTVTLFSKDPFVKERIVIVLPGSDDPTPPDDPLGTPISKLSAKVDALVKSFNDFAAAQAAFNKSVRADVDKLMKNPPVPVPVDAFQKAVNDAYALDGKDKANAANLASLYSLGVKSIVYDASLTKIGDVQTKMHTAAQSLFKENGEVKVLVNVRRALADEFNRAIGGKTGDPLTDATRKLIAAEFLKAQRALESVGP